MSHELGPRLTSPEALFMFGGEAQSPVFAQPGIPEPDLGHWFPYRRGDAGVEAIQHSQSLNSLSAMDILEQRYRLSEQISRNIVGTEEMEASRLRLARFMNHYYRRYELT